jgi:hypothetical protein
MECGAARAAFFPPLGAADPGSDPLFYQQRKLLTV